MDITTSERVTEVHFLHRGTAQALQTRVKQLNDLVYAQKQHIYLLRKTEQKHISLRRKATSHLNPLLSTKQIYATDRVPENVLSAENGVRSLIEALNDYDIKSSNSIEKLYNPQNALSNTILALNTLLIDIDS